MSGFDTAQVGMSLPVAVGQRAILTSKVFGSLQTSTVTVSRIDGNTVWVHYGPAGASFPVRLAQLSVTADDSATELA